MKLLFKQRFFSWLDSYDIYTEDGEPIYTVEGKLSLGHRLDILDAGGAPVGRVQEEIFTLLPRFQLFLSEEFVGEIRKEFSLLKPKYALDCNGWQITGDFWGWDYQIENASGQTVAWISKEVFNWTDTYVLNVPNSGDVLPVLMVALAIDAANCSQS